MVLRRRWVVEKQGLWDTWALINGLAKAGYQSTVGNGEKAQAAGGTWSWARRRARWLLWPRVNKACSEGNAGPWRCGGGGRRARAGWRWIASWNGCRRGRGRLANRAKRVLSGPPPNQSRDQISIPADPLHPPSPIASAFPIYIRLAPVIA